MPCYSHQHPRVKQMNWLKKCKTCLTMHQRRQPQPTQLREARVKWPKRCNTSLTKPTMHQRRQPQPRLIIIQHQHRLVDFRSQAVWQPVIPDAVLEATAKLSLAATVMWSATISTTAVMISQPVAATVSVPYILCSLSHLFLTVKYISFLWAESPEIFMFIILNV